MTVEAFWEDFIKHTHKDRSVQYLESFYFDISKESANNLLDLVLKGKKQATASSLLVYETTDSKLPQIGDFSIVTNWDGDPQCVIETIAVTIIPFHEITYDICKREGEDECLETWQTGHRKFFETEGNSFGYTFTEDMPVVFEDFKVVYTK